MSDTELWYIDAMARIDKTHREGFAGTAHSEHEARQQLQLWRDTTIGQHPDAVITSFSITRKDVS